jgi:hypothetical protein
MHWELGYGFYLCMSLKFNWCGTMVMFFYFYSYGYSKERFVWSLISAVGIFCLGSGATVVNGVQNLWVAQVFNQTEFLK